MTKNRQHKSYSYDSGYQHTNRQWLNSKYLGTECVALESTFISHVVITKNVENFQFLNEDKNESQSQAERKR